MECYNLKSVILPNNIKTIGQSAFNNCHDLENIKLPRTTSRFSNPLASTTLGK